MHCPHCGQEHPDGLIFCPVTGQKLATASYCMVCGTKLEASWKICPNCGAPVGQTLQPRVSSKPEQMGQPSDMQSSGLTGKYALYGIFAFLIIFIAAGAYLVFTDLLESPPSVVGTSEQPAETSNQKLPTDTPSPQPTETSLPIPTTTPLLNDEEFPSNPVDYPQEWPENLLFPEPFQLVKTASGGPTGEAVMGREVRLRYPGSLQEAAHLLIGFFEARGWLVEERLEAGDGGLILFLARNERSNTGIIIFAPSIQYPNHVNIHAIIFQ